MAASPLERGVKEPAPQWVWPLLAVALLAVSSAAPVLRTMAAVPPLLRASWRQQLTTALVLPAAFSQYRSLDMHLKARLRRPAVVLRVLGSGILLAAHFGLWIWSIDHTTLTHSVLLVSANPVLLALGRAALRLPIDLVGELGGAVLGFFGMAVSMIGELVAVQPPPPDGVAAASAGVLPEEVQLAGDLAALAGAASFVLYLLIGHELRQWLPAFVYITPVFGVSALALTAAAAIGEGATLSGGRGNSGGHAELSADGLVAEPAHALATFGWASLEWAPSAFFLALGPGVCGHAALNVCVAHLDPLLISVVLLAEPIVSSLLGWALAVSSVPGPWTFAGGPLLLAGCVLTVWGAHRRERAQASGEAGAGGRARLPLGGALRLDSWRLRGAQRLADTDALASHHVGGGVGSVDDVAEDLWGAGAGHMVGDQRGGAAPLGAKGLGKRAERQFEMWEVHATPGAAAENATTPSHTSASDGLKGAMDAAASNASAAGSSSGGEAPPNGAASARLDQAARAAEHARASGLEAEDTAHDARARTCYAPSGTQREVAVAADDSQPSAAPAEPPQGRLDGNMNNGASSPRSTHTVLHEAATG